MGTNSVDLLKRWLHTAARILHARGGILCWGREFVTRRHGFLGRGGWGADSLDLVLEKQAATLKFSSTYCNAYARWSFCLDLYRGIFGLRKTRGEWCGWETSIDLSIHPSPCQGWFVEC